jgi:hypothetical protein
LGDDGATADVGVGSDSRELVHGRESADGGPLFDGDVSGECGGVGHDDVVADEAVVSDMCVGHDEAMTADLRELAAFDGAAMDGDVFADLVMVADLEASGFTFVGKILRAHADDGEREDAIVAAELCGSLEYDVGDEFAVLSHLNVGPDYAERSNGARLWNAYRGIDEGGGMNAHSSRFVVREVVDRWFAVRGGQRPDR